MILRAQSSISWPGAPRAISYIPCPLSQRLCLPARRCGCAIQLLNLHLVGQPASPWGGDIVSWLSCLFFRPRAEQDTIIMASISRSVRNTRGGLASKGGFSRDSPRGRSNGCTPRGGGGGGGTGAWGSGRLDRSLPARHGNGGDAGGQQQQRSPSAAGVNAGDGYKVACRDRWMNVTKTMMGERAEITTISGCVYEGVFHVLTAGNDPGGKRGVYRVRCCFLCWFFCFFSCRAGCGTGGSLKQGDFAHVFCLTCTAVGCPREKELLVLRSAFLLFLWR